MVHFYSGVLVGNKIDKENYRAVSTQEGKQLAASRKLAFFECSAVSEIILHTKEIRPFFVLERQQRHCRDFQISRQ